MTHVEQTLTRILSHEWTQQPLKLSHVRLFEEFIHRYALWIDATDNRDWYRGFNLPKLFSDDVCSAVEKLDKNHHTNKRGFWGLAQASSSNSSGVL
ncbi:MAG: hypothetical protein L0154_14160, partial [Chloroflexi bacterium]|nr:hypothetical protein [Chloroflexota bacterium]